MESKFLDAADKIEKFNFQILIDYIEKTPPEDIILDDFYQEAKKYYLLLKENVAKLDKEYSDIWEYDIKPEVKDNKFQIVSRNNKDAKTAKEKAIEDIFLAEMLKDKILMFIIEHRVLF